MLAEFLSCSYSHSYSYSYSYYLSKKAFCFFKKSFAERVDIRIAQIGELLQFAPLRAVEMSWHFHQDANVQISGPITLDISDPLAFDPENGAGLRASRDFDARFTCQRRHFQVGAQRRLDKIDRHITKQIIAITLKNIVLLHVQDDVEIPGRTATQTAFSVTGRAQASAVVDSSRDFDLYL